MVCDLETEGDVKLLLLMTKQDIMRIINIFTKSDKGKCQNKNTISSLTTQLCFTNAAIIVAITFSGSVNWFYEFNANYQRVFFVLATF